MTVKERILEAVDNMDCEKDNMDKLIALAYYIGRESAARELCDKARVIFDKQRKTANACRYHNMAMQIQGGHTYIYHGNHGQTMTDMFASDVTNL